MSQHPSHKPTAAPSGMPAEPLTLEGWYVLHQMFRVRWPQWKALGPVTRGQAVAEASQLLERMEGRADGQSAAFSMLGHKGDLMLLHFRRSPDELRAAELEVAASHLGDFLEPTTSYLSVVELGLYEISLKLYGDFIQRGLEPGSDRWREELEAELQHHRRRVEMRLWPRIPDHRYLCFYPMDKRRGDNHNWYELPIEQRQLLMRDHGMVGRRYAGRVSQIISGSIGFDDWEWGVDLFAADPLVFKKLVYEMRFDQASAIYGLFGAFHLGIRTRPNDLGSMLAAPRG